MAGIQFAEPLVEALKLVGPNLSKEACIEKLNTFINWKGLGGAITWNKNRHQGTDSVQIHKCGPEGKSILLQDWTSNELATWKKQRYFLFVREPCRPHTGPAGLTSRQFWKFAAGPG